MSFPITAKPIEWYGPADDWDGNHPFSYWRGLMGGASICTVRQRYLDVFDLDAIWDTDPHQFTTLAAAQESAQQQWNVFIRSAIQPIDDDTRKAMVDKVAAVYTAFPIDTIEDMIDIALTP